MLVMLASAALHGLPMLMMLVCVTQLAKAPRA